MSRVGPLKDMLLTLMPVPSTGDWGPQPVMCRWCGCWLEYSDGRGKPVELHTPDCFAAVHLGRPHKGGKSR